MTKTKKRPYSSRQNGIFKMLEQNYLPTSVLILYSSCSMEVMFDANETQLNIMWNWTKTKLKHTSFFQVLVSLILVSAGFVSFGYQRDPDHVVMS